MPTDAVTRAVVAGLYTPTLVLCCWCDELASGAVHYAGMSHPACDRHQFGPGDSRNVPTDADLARMARELDSESR